MKSFVPGEGSEFLSQILLKRQIPLLVPPGGGKKLMHRSIISLPLRGRCREATKGDRTQIRAVFSLPLRGRCREATEGVKNTNPQFATFPVLFQAFPQAYPKSLEIRLSAILSYRQTQPPEHFLQYRRYKQTPLVSGRIFPEATCKF